MANAIEVPRRGVPSIAPSGVAYPAFTKLGQILGKPSSFPTWTWELNSANGPYGFAIIDTWACGVTNLTYRYYAVSTTDHEPGGTADGGFWVAASDNPRSGWVWTNSGAKIIDKDDVNGGSDGHQLEAAMFCDWNQAIGKFVLYPHLAGFNGPTGIEQVTVRITTEDFVTFTPEGIPGSSSAIVLKGQGDHHGYAYGCRPRAGVFLLHHRRHGMYGFLEGTSVAYDIGGQEFNALPEFSRPAAVNAVLDDPEAVMIGVHQPFYFANQWWGLYTVRTSTGQAAGLRDESIYLAPLADDCTTITGKPVEVIPQGGSGAIDEATAHAMCVLLQDDGIYIYYSAINASFVQVIAAAKCNIKPDGSYDKYAA